MMGPSTAQHINQNQSETPVIENYLGTVAARARRGGGEGDGGGQGAQAGTSQGSG